MDALAGERNAVRLDCEQLTTREINQELRRLAEQEIQEVEILNPGGRHNLAVALFGHIRLSFAGSVGYYAAAMIDGPTVQIDGNCGWGVGEDMLSGTIHVRRNAGNSAGAAMRGGRLLVCGDAGARAGASMKGGLIAIGGSAGYMTGFMMQKGIIVICGDTGEALGDSMYQGQIFVGGHIGGLGNDTIEAPLTSEDRDFLIGVIEELGTDTDVARFRKIECAKRLWNFSKKEGLWKEAL